MNRVFLILLFIGGIVATSQAKTIRLPAFDIIEAIQKAQQFVHERKLDVSHHFVMSAEYKNLHDEREGGFWEVTFALRAGASEPCIILRVAQDSTVTIVSPTSTDQKRPQR